MGNQMQSFLMNNQIYEVQANNQISSILSQFDADYVMDIIDDTLNQVFTRFDMIPRPNIVRSFETTFKELHNVYPADIDNIDELRVEIYQNIIDHICKKYELRFIQTDHVDLFTLADIIYDFFVSNFNIYMVQFYVKLLLREKDNIVYTLNMDEIKKSKDPNIKYNRLAFDNNDEFVAIAINLPTILKNLAALDIMDHTIYSYIYGPRPEMVNLIESSISSSVPIFQRFNNLLFNESLYGPIITYIRLAFQQSISPVDINPSMAANLQ